MDVKAHDEYTKNTYKWVFYFAQVIFTALAYKRNPKFEKYFSMDGIISFKLSAWTGKLLKINNILKKINTVL